MAFTNSIFWLLLIKTRPASESILRNNDWPKLKLSKLLADNRLRIFVQNLPALEKTLSESVLLAGIVCRSNFSRSNREQSDKSFIGFHKCGITKFYVTWFLRKIAQSAVISRKTFTQRKQNFAFRSAKIAQNPNRNILHHIIKASIWYQKFKH